MNQTFDIYNRPEQPQIILCKPTGEELFEIKNYEGFKTDCKYNDVSQISFTVYSSIGSDYEEIKGKKYLTIDGYGIYMIDDVTKNEIGNRDFKNVQCKSVDFEWSYKRISLLSTTYKLYDVFSPQTSLLGIIIGLMPSWSIGSVDSSVGNQYRYFDIEDKQLLQFLYSDIEDAYQCIIEPDYETRTINVVALENVGSPTDIYLSKRNLIDSIKISELSNEIVTDLKVFGGNGLDIVTVNPTGTSSIRDLTYFKTTEWISQELIDALNDYEILYTNNETTYNNLLTSYKTNNLQLLTLQTELGLLIGEKNALVTVQMERIQAGIPTVSIYTDILLKQVEINSKNNSISSKISTLLGIYNSLIVIVGNLSLPNNFTSQQIKDIDKLTIEYTYQNDAYMITDNMTNVQIQEQQELLLEDGKKILSRLSQPRFSFSIDLVDFLKLVPYEVFIAQFGLANSMFINLNDGSTVEVRLISYSHDWDSNKLTLNFTNKYRVNDPTYLYTELFKKSIDAGVSVSFSKFQYSDWNKNSKDEVTTFINSSLNASLNNLISSSNQDMIWDGNGLRARQSNGSGGYLDEQLWLVNNMLAFSDDGFETAKMAIGKIQDERYGELWGIVAPNIVGELLSGVNLRITNIANQFTLDERGAILTDASFTLTTSNNKGKIILDPVLGIKIQGNLSGSFVDSFYVSVDGRIKANNIDILGNGTFGGTLSSGISISAPVILGGSININNKFVVNSAGFLSAVGGTFLNAYVSGTIASGTQIVAPIITGGTITGNVISGVSISGSTINGGIYYNSFGDTYLNMGITQEIRLGKTSDSSGLSFDLQNGVDFSSVDGNNNMYNILNSALGTTIANNIWSFTLLPKHGSESLATQTWVTSLAGGNVTAVFG